MNREERVHEINYALEFAHLLSDNERAALGAVVFDVMDGGVKWMSITLKDGVEPDEEIRRLLQDGMFPLRQRLADRLLTEHRDIVYENCCTRCGQLPRTPRARQCRFCGFSWR
jgi:hypothetical protein